MLLSEFNFIKGVGNLANAVRNKIPRIRVITPKYAKKLSVGRTAIATSRNRAASINRNITPNSMADGMTSVIKRAKYKP